MTANTNKACCTIPPIDSDYTPKGEYKYIGDLKTYVTGSTSSTRVITVIYDIFDIIAAQGFLVVVPDFFKGKPLAQENYPPDTPEKEKIVQAFFAGPASPPDNLKLLSSFATAASKEFPQVTGHGILGYCWGGKIAVLASGQRDVFEATAVVHPAMLQADDATSLTAPIMLLASKDEDAKEVKAFEAAVPKGAVKDASHFETYTNMHHGWAAARADLSTQEKKDVYSETYEKLSGFFTKNIKE